MPKIEQIELSVDEQLRLVAKLEEMREAAIDFKAQEWDSLHEEYWRQYLSHPESETKNTPWEGASNLFIPLTRVIVEGVLAQEYDAMLANDPIVKVIAEDEEEARLLSDYYGEYVFKRLMNLKELGSDLLLDNAVDGTSAFKSRWNRDWVVRRIQRVEEISRYETVRENLEGVEVETQILTGVEYENVEDAVIQRVEEPSLDITDMDRIYFAPNSGPSFQYPMCPWYYQKQDLTWDDLVARRRDGYKNIDDELKILLQATDLTEKERLIRDKEGLSEDAEDTIEVDEFYMRWPLPSRYQRVYSNKTEAVNQVENDEDGFMEEVIVTFVPRARRILRIVPLQRIYADGLRPHIDNRYSRLPRFPYGVGLASVLRHLNAAMNTSWNQFMDFGTLQNLPFVLYEPAALGMMPEIMGVTPGKWYPVMNSRGVNIPRMNGDPNFWLGAMQQEREWGEKLGTISDFNLGRAPSTPNAPRTARGTAYILQQSNIAFSRMIALHSIPFVKMFYRMHALHGRWAPPETSFNFHREGKRYAAKVPQSAFRQEIDFEFVLNPNRQYEQQQAQMLLQVMAPFVQAFNPPGLIPMLEELWHLSGKKNFNKIIPDQILQQIKLQQQQQAAMMPPPAGVGAPQLPTVPTKEPKLEEVDVSFKEGVNGRPEEHIVN